MKPYANISLKMPGAMSNMSDAQKRGDLLLKNPLDRVRLKVTFYQVLTVQKQLTDYTIQWFLLQCKKAVFLHLNKCMI